MMDNYYHDKYNLDIYSDSGLREHSGAKRASSRSERTPGKAAKSSYRSTPSRSPKPKKPEKPKKTAEKAKARKSSAPSAQAPKPEPKAAVKKNIYRAPRKKSTSLRVLGIVAIVFAVAVLIAGSCVLGYNIYIENKKKAPFKFSEGVEISGIDIGNLSLDEAKAKLDSESMKAVKDFSLSVTANKTEKTYTKSDFSYKFSYDSQLEEARIYSLKEQGIYEYPEGETPPENEELVTPELKIDYKLKKKSVETVVEELAKEVNKNPKNAKVSKFKPFAEDKFEYKKGSYGYYLHQNELVEDVVSFVNSGRTSGELTANVTKLSPDITVKDLKKNIVGLSTATSVSYNTEDGNTNMAVALKACSGSVIEPNEIWSFNDCTGDSNDPANGYKKATVINDRKLEEGYGGGICQASTTIFRAAALANMGIIERHNHYWASGYALAGEDATIDYPYLDLKLRNNTDYQMFIECEMDGTTLVVNIYGVQEDYYDNVKLYTKNYDIVKKKSFNTSTYRVLYLDGEIISEDIICESNYSLTQKHVVQDEDKGTFRTMVDGTVKYETEPTTAPPETEAETQPEEEDETEEIVTEPEYEEESENEEENE